MKCEFSLSFSRVAYRYKSCVYEEIIFFYYFDVSTHKITHHPLIPHLPFTTQPGLGNGHMLEDRTDGFYFIFISISFMIFLILSFLYSNPPTKRINGPVAQTGQAAELVFSSIFYEIIEVNLLVLKMFVTKTIFRNYVQFSENMSVYKIMKIILD